MFWYRNVGEKMTHLKSTGVAIGKVVFVALGVPYGIAILVNSVHKWPQSDPSQGRVSKQLKPSRVLKLNYAICEQLGMLKWLPLLLRGKVFYSNTESALKNIPFGENSLKMDIWLPGFQDNQQKRPVIFFIYGGAWGSGCKEWYAKIGQQLADKLKAVVVIPDYRTYPKGNMHHMVNDIIDAVSEFRKSSITLNISADINRIVLIGHSAGAHLSTMAAVNVACQPINCSAQLSDMMTDNSAFQNDLVENRFEDCPAIDQAEKKTAGNICSESFQCKETGVESCVENRVEMDQPVRNAESGAEIDLAICVRGVIGIGGVYHIMDHYHHEAKRGVEDISPMWRAAEGMENFGKYSPTSVVPTLNDNQKKRLPPHILIHGLEDKTVPLSSSSKYAEILSEAGVPTVLKLIPEGGHADLVMDMMESDRQWYNVMMSMVMEGVTSFF